MIKKFKLLRNIGPFVSVATNNLQCFARLTMIYAENGRGKTNLSAVLRSLAENDPVPLLERKRLGTADAPHAAVECDGSPTAAVFQNGTWDRSYPQLRVFDDAFINNSVYSGLDISPSHRQNLHDLIIGREGVSLAREMADLSDEIADLQREMRVQADAIPQATRGLLSVDDFCSLTAIDEIDRALDEATRRLSALSQAEAVRTTPAFEPFEPPTPEFENIRTLLNRTISDIDSNATAAVQNHFQRLGKGAEIWISEGVRLAADSDVCPFCDRGTNDVKLIEHYRAYFGKAYADHKRQIETTIAEIERILGGSASTRFQGLIHSISDRHRFWAPLITLPMLDLDTDAIVNTWETLRTNLLRLLGAKQAAPLDLVDLDAQTITAIKGYASVIDSCRTLSRSLLDRNEDIHALRQVTATGDLTTARSDLGRLNATKLRFGSGVAPLCDAYLDAKLKKEDAERRKVGIRETLDGLRQTVFPKYQTSINEYLRKFNAGFRITEVRPENPRGTPSSSYQIEINSCLVPVSQPLAGQPAFKNTLSAGDRNALALAFFFASLDQEAHLASLVVVIDDPVSSLDDGRTLTTAQEIRALSQRTSQVILLSHSKRLLCMVWQHADRNNCTAFAVVPCASGSTIDSWRVSEEAVTEYDRRHELLRRYASGTERDVRKVAESLRHVLEGYLRVACPEHFPPGALLGNFINTARQRLSDGSPILGVTDIDELDAITEYANRFHHDSNPSWDIEMNNINETQLGGFVRRVLGFTAIGTSAGAPING